MIQMQQFINLVALLLEPQGGTRPITLTPISYRVVCKHARSVQGWEDAIDTVHESAGKGKSALAAALIRNIIAQVTVWCGGFVAALLNDFEKLYDHIEIATLILYGIKHEFPLEWLAITIVFIRTFCGKCGKQKLVTCGFIMKLVTLFMQTGYLEEGSKKH